MNESIDTSAGIERDQGALLAQYLLLRNAVLDPQLSAVARMVLVVILDHRNKGSGRAFPGMDRMAAITGAHRTSHMRAVAELERAGYIVVERQSNRPNVYRVASWPSDRALPTNRTHTTSRIDATGSADTTGCTDAVEPVASVHTDRSHPCTEPVAPMRPEPAFNLLKQPTDEPTQEASASLSPSGKLSTRKKAKKQTFHEWLDSLSDDENEAAAERISAFIAKIGAPEDYADIFMRWAGDTWSDNPDKAQASWPRTIDNYLRNAWHRLWAPSREGGFYLTTAGEQLRREIAAEEGRPAHASSNRPRRDLDAEHVPLPNPGRRPSAVEQVEQAIAARHAREGRTESVSTDTRHRELL